MNKDLIDFLLLELRLRPGMYLRAYKLSHLNIFLSGIQISCYQLDKDDKYSGSFFGKHGFLQWSWSKHNIDKPSYILDHYLDISNGNEENALNCFFNDLEEFTNERRRVSAPKIQTV